MSHIMEKTLSSIPKLLSQSLIGSGGSTKMPQRQTPPPDVQNFMKNVHRARSKSHEARIVNSELSLIQQRLKRIDIGDKHSVLRNSFTKALFCHLLGYDVHFIGIETIKFASQGRGFDKYLGYLMSCLLLGPQSEITLLMMSTVIKDLHSSNILDNCVALKVAGEMVVSADIISQFFPYVLSKFSHQHDLVKEKAIHCFCSFYRNSPELLHSDLERLNLFLTSRDPGVLMAVMNVFVILTSENPGKYLGLGSSFLHILNQINNRGFGSNYYYQMTPLPWLQISLLKVLGNIGHVDPHLSDHLCPLLKALIEKTKVSVPISLAVLVECIVTATKIYPNEQLLHLCSLCISKLLSSDANEDMRYQGLGLLIALSRIKQSFVSQHQVAIVECLNNEDSAIQSRTTLLLHAMANRANVRAICSKLFEQLASTKETSFQQDTLMMISDLAERFSPNTDWYISTMFCILSYTLNQTLQDKVMDLVLRKVKTLSEPNMTIDKNSISNLSATFFTILEKRNYNQAEFSLAIQLFGTLAPVLQEDFSSERFLHILSVLFNDKNAMTSITKKSTMCLPDSFCNESINKLVLDKGETKLKLLCVMTLTKMMLCKCIEPPLIIKWLDTLTLKNSLKNSFVRNELQELEDLARHPNDIVMKSFIFSQGHSDIDFSLSFLDSLVIEDMLSGNDCYNPLYIQKMDTLQLLPDSSSSSLAVLGEEDKEVDYPELMTNSQTSQTKSKMATKWRDDDLVVEDDWNITNISDSSEQFLLVDSDDKHSEKVDKRQKAAQELFAGLDEPNFDHVHPPVEFSMTNKGFGNNRKLKTIWDDDDGDDNDDVNRSNKKLGIFNVSNIEINPFGISKHPKTKPAKWTQDYVNTGYFSAAADIGIPIKPLSSLSHASDNDNNQFDFHDSMTINSMYASPVEPYNSIEVPFSKLDQPWSDQEETLSSIREKTVIPGYSGSPVTDSISYSLSGSAVDALTDSDPETPSC